jgi:hypothetical protein
MRVPNIGWIAVLAGIAVVVAIVWSGILSRSRPTEQATNLPEARRTDLVQAAKAFGTIAAARADQPNPQELQREARPEPEAAIVPPPPAAPSPLSRQSKPAESTWTVKPPTKSDGAPEDNSLCGGKVCRGDQFCCGPPECGRCASRLSGPRCPTICP